MGNPGSGWSVCDRVDRGIRGSSGGKSSGILTGYKEKEKGRHSDDMCRLFLCHRKLRPMTQKTLR